LAEDHRWNKIIGFAGTGETLATQLMIYETAVPVSHARHGNWSVEVGTDYAFCRNINSVPLMTAEFASAALEYAVVFGRTGETVMPVTVLGVRTDENLYVTKEGGWQAKYIPGIRAPLSLRLFQRRRRQEVHALH
jgi:SapC protein